MYRGEVVLSPIHFLFHQAYYFKGVNAFLLLTYLHKPTLTQILKPTLVLILKRTLHRDPPYIPSLSQ